MEQATCPECGHVEEARDALSAGMLVTAHQAEAHETDRQRRVARAVATNPDAWYGEG